MTSADIENLSSWEAWPDLALAKAPKTPGVYIFRLSKRFGRVQGESDLLYIGLARANLARTLAGHRHRGVGRVLELVRGVGHLQVAWKSCAGRLDAERTESRLLAGYAREHIELPPLNRQQSLAVWQRYISSLGGLWPAKPVERLEELGDAVMRGLEKRMKAPRGPVPG